jgi:hypothetical protein
MEEPILENRLVTIQGRRIHINEEEEMSVRECYATKLKEPVAHMEQMHLALGETTEKQ